MVCPRDRKGQTLSYLHVDLTLNNFWDVALNAE